VLEGYTYDEVFKSTKDEEMSQSTDVEDPTSFPVYDVDDEGSVLIVDKKKKSMVGQPMPL
jgi:hypothetical protein